jgi:hypothetical protein
MKTKAGPAGLFSERNIMMRKLLIGGLAAAGLAVAIQRHDIVRYLRINQMSLGAGHPEIVPASGSPSYPAPGHGTPDGTGEFDSAARGGPDGELPDRTGE